LKKKKRKKKRKEKQKKNDEFKQPSLFVFIVFA